MGGGGPNSGQKGGVPTICPHWNALIGKKGGSNPRTPLDPPMVYYKHTIVLYVFMYTVYIEYKTTSFTIVLCVYCLTVFSTVFLQCVLAVTPLSRVKRQVESYWFFVNCFFFFFHKWTSLLFVFSRRLDCFSFLLIFSHIWLNGYVLLIVEGCTLLIYIVLTFIQSWVPYTFNIMLCNFLLTPPKVRSLPLSYQSITEYLKIK